MKRKLLFLAALAAGAFGLNANAQSFSGEDGNYYLQNVASGLYWGAGNSWGTQASLLKNPEYVTLVKNEDGTYKMDSQVTNGGENHYFNGDFMDNNSPVPLTITVSGDYYTIANDAIYYGWDGGASTVLGKDLEATSPNALWKIISEADMKASLANATAENPVNATFLILDPNFSRNNRNKSSWSMVASNQNLAGGDNTNTCAESYHAVFTLSQKIENAPKGVYKLNAQGFYREDPDAGATADIPYIYINDEKSTFNERGTILDGYKGNDRNDGMGHASAAFTDGHYTIAPAFVELTADGDITVGAKLENSTNLWCIWDNFELTYYGPDATIAEVRFGDLVKQVDALVETATALLDNENVSDATKDALTAAIDGADEIEAEEEAYNAAIATLTAAVQKANKDIANKPAIDAMYELMESTNVYTTEAYNTYKALADDYLSKYEAGTLTETVVNPTSVMDWHATNNVDDFLLSAWTIGGEQAKDYDKALHINVWSTEGNNDGTNFGTPFFEYWVGDGDVLGSNTITATVEDVEPGLYAVTAWVRVRTTNGKDPKELAGITLSVNDGEAVDVTKGTQTVPTGVGFFNLAEYKAIGTVEEDGKLTIKFDVDTENISWLSFKNVKYTPTTKEQVEYEKALASITDGNYYQVSTTVEDKTYYLKTNGTLTDNKDEAGNFVFKAENAAGTKYETGWNLGYKFTNPNTTGDKGTGDPKNEGSIRTNTNANDNDRVDWERQVFFLGDNGEYAVRATNANSENWGANTFWAVVDGKAGYALEAAYVWNLEDITATEEDYEALNDALAAAELEAEGKTLGFDKDEYAPYTHADIFQAIAAAKAINQEVVNLHTTVAAITEALKGEWVANTEEVNAVYDGTFANAENNGAPLGWTMSNNTLGGATHSRAFVGDERLSEFNETNSGFFVRFDGNYSDRGSMYYYGNTEGYTMPLKADSYYTVSLDFTNWGTTDNKPLRLNVSGPEGFTATGQTVNSSKDADKGNNAPDNITITFKTADAGNYVISLQCPGDDGNKHNVLVSNVTLYRQTTSVEVSDAGYATYVTPMDVDFGDKVEAYIVEEVATEDGEAVAQLSPITEAPAGTPVIIKADEGEYKLTVIAEAAEVEGENLLQISEGTETGAGYYVLANLEKGVGFYALADDYTLPEGKVYLPYSVAGVKFIGFDGGNATGINGVENAANGVENAVIYNVAGQRVSNPTKGGIYIINGKKVLVK